MQLGAYSKHWPAGPSEDPIIFLEVMLLHVGSLKASKCMLIKFTLNQFDLLEMERKLSEKYKEYLATRSTEELAYIIVVIYRIAELMGVDRNNLEKIRKDKIVRSGAFSRNSFLIEIGEL